MKKIKYVIIVTALTMSAFLFGRFGNRDIIDMNQVADIQADTDGAQITLLDGNGYYWER
ncbi:hypothetical protein [Lacrimispora sp.]|uniref:hypothetical protein n=1 Tax=Lacrimispora sp. TaxID=2719234 RepID=UPI0028A73B54|nr:hypothetical protein [Lacrimispora sp.]